MIFALITFIAAFSIEALGTIVSVIGLSTLFGANPIVMALAVSLDIGKLVVVTLLYTYWSKLNRLMKTYGLIAAVVTMTITSAGAASYLSGEFQKAIIGTQEGSLKVSVLKDEQSKLEARKKQIDDQIANLPANYSRSRVTLMKQFETEQKQVTTRLAQINAELPTIQLAQISTEAKAGPILSIAKAFDISVEQAVKWVILMIIFVFDPLAVFLIVAGNFLLDQRRPKPVVDLFEDDPDRGNPSVIPRSRLLRVPDEPVPSEQIVTTFSAPVQEPIYEVLQPTPKGSEPIHPTPIDPHLAYEMREAALAGLSLEAWREQQLKKLDRLQQGVDALRNQVEHREQITKSSLGIVTADPSTMVNAPTTSNEIGIGTGVYPTGPTRG